MLIWLLNALNGRDELKKQVLLHIHELKGNGKCRGVACLMNLISRAHKKKKRNSTEHKYTECT